MAATNLRISGPTPLPDAVRAATARQMMSHRCAGFRELFGSVVHRLGPVFGDPATVLPFTCSGTGGLEAAVVNLVQPGQRVLVASIGYFGERFAEIARAAGAEVEVLSLPWGRAVTPDELRAALRRQRSVTAVLITHNETSTGVLNPLGDLCRVVHEESDALVVVDVVSSLAATPVLMRDWGIDAAVGVTQKALMSPPGLALVGVSERALATARHNPRPRYYFDFDAMARSVAEATTTFTPAVSVCYALAAALDLIEAEGFGAVVARHEQLTAQCRRTVRDFGLELFANDADASVTVTAVLLPPGLTTTEVRDRLEREHGVLLASGRGRWKDRMVRIGHMGNVSAAELDAALDALGVVCGRPEARA